MSDEAETFGGVRAERPWKQAIARGMAKRCPQCGVGALFDGYSRTHAKCSHCGLELSGHRADDAPPYLTILIVGHILVPIALAVQQSWALPMWLQFAIWLPAIIIATLWFLPIAKGGLIALQWANRMHGFAPGADPRADA